ncbi:hypothetical protein P3T76_000052 [Phytophthora citrophthora]|uniref:Uncharacterized protein n=1 Tax=Phytophthora citrophthora TaxID=4793 RepID=A0AAD9GZS2_9STRA|nr:hypothetical protein P3T76_000052 [Phytophthora citrophthora]
MEENERTGDGNARTAVASMAMHSDPVVASQQDGGDDFDDVHHERQRWCCHIFPPEVVKAD